MKISLHDVSKGRNGQALPSTSLEFHTGAVRFALAEGGHPNAVLISPNGVEPSYGMGIH